MDAVPWHKLCSGELKISLDFSCIVKLFCFTAQTVLKLTSFNSYIIIVTQIQKHLFIN